jgi:hypothetical protein
MIAPALGAWLSLGVALASTTAVGSRYDTTPVHVTPAAVDAFVAGWGATFGGTHTVKVLTTVTPSPGKTESELVMSPVGTLSVSDFKTPAPIGSAPNGRAGS